MICRAECLALYGKEQILQGYSNVEGQELSGLSTSEHSQVHWDDELMQSRSSMSSASDPFLILTHTFITLLISFPLCLILLTHSYLFRLPSFFPPISLFLSPSYPPPSVSLVSLQHLLCIAAARK